MQNSEFSVEKIADRSYRLDECGLVNCYLLLGNERALLIDTGLGIGRLKDEVEKLTDLPLDVALTHAHCDHAGGVDQFPRYYVGKADRARVYGLLSSRFAASLMTPKGKKLQRFPAKAQALCLQEGQTFDLGGRLVRTVAAAGHTRSSTAFADEGEGLLLTGDAINPSLWMQLPGCTTLKAWLRGGRTLLALAQDHTPWCGHGEGRQSAEQLLETFDLVETLSKGKNAWPGRTAVYPAKDRMPQLVYRTDRKN